MMKLYDFPVSGNAYKARLMLALLKIDYERIEVPLREGGARTPEFLAKNPAGHVPVLELDDGTCIAESSAILYYLAQGTPYMPEDPVQAAKVIQWMAFEQLEIMRHIVGLRIPLLFLKKTPEELGEFYEKTHAAGNFALDALEDALADSRFIAGDAATIADIALYGYVPLAHQVNFDLTRRPHILAWIDRMKRLKGYVPIDV